MRTRLFLALLAIPTLCAALPGDAAAQRRDHRRVYVHRDDVRRDDIRRYRDRIVISSHRYKDSAGRHRGDVRRIRASNRDAYRYRDGYRYRDQYEYRDQSGYRYRDQYRYRDRDRYDNQYGRRRRVNLVDLVLSAAGAHRHSNRCGHRRGIHIDL